jgi:hypothetical protein
MPVPDPGPVPVPDLSFADEASPRFDHERLDVYRVAIVDIATHLSGGRLTKFDGDNAFIDVGREMRKSLLRIVAMLTRMASIGQNRGRGRERDRER